MIKVRIYNLLDDYEFETVLPFLPNPKDKIGYWLDGQFYVGRVDHYVFEFDKNNNLEFIEINGHFES